MIIIQRILKSNYSRIKATIISNKIISFFCRNTNVSQNSEQLGIDGTYKSSDI